MSPQIQVEALICNAIVFGGGTFGRQLGLDEVMKGGASMMGLVPL